MWVHPPVSAASARERCPVSDPNKKTPCLLRLYQRYLRDAETGPFIKAISERYTVGTLTRLAGSQCYSSRRAAVMAEFADVCGDGALPLLNGGVVGMGQGLRGQVSPADLYAMAARLLAQTDATSVDELALYFTAAARGLDVHLL